MTPDIHSRKQLLHRFIKIPESKLKEMDQFLTRFKRDSLQQITVASFAGTWRDVKDDIFKNLTTDRITKRKSRRHIMDEVLMKNWTV